MPISLLITMITSVSISSHFLFHLRMNTNLWEVWCQWWAACPRWWRRRWWWPTWWSRLHSKVWLCNIVWQSGSGCDDVSRRANHFRTISHHQRWNTETLTQWQLLPGVWGQREAQHRHGGDQETRHDQVGEVVQRPPPDLDGEGDVKIRLRAAIIDHLVPDGGDAWRIKLWWGISNVAWNFERREFDI